MIRPKRTAQLLAVSAAAALVLSSCGGSDDNGDSGSDNTSSPDETTAAAPTGDGVLTIGSFLPQTGDLASSARRSSPVSTWLSRTSTTPAECSASRSSRPRATPAT